MDDLNDMICGLPGMFDKHQNIEAADEAFFRRKFPEQGALMSYGPDLHDLFRRLPSRLIEFSKAVSQVRYESNSRPSSSLW